MNLSRTIAPDFGPLTAIDDVREALNISHIHDDRLLEAFAATAWAEVEDRVRMSLAPTAWRLTDSRFPKLGTPLELLRQPIVAVTSVQYWDGAAYVTLVEGTDFEADLAGDRIPGRIAPLAGAYWPAVTSRTLVGIAVEYTAGYADAATIPAPIREWVLRRIGTLYEHREESVEAVQIRTVESLDALLGGYGNPVPPT